MDELQAVCEALDTKISDLVATIEVSADHHLAPGCRLHLLVLE